MSAVKPSNMSQEDWDAHVKAAQAETARRAAVEANPTDTMLDIIARVEKLEGKKSEAPAAAPKKARR